MTPEELNQFLGRHQMSTDDLAGILGVTKPAVDHWVTRRRKVPVTVAKVLRLFEKYPQLMTGF